MAVLGVATCRAGGLRPTTLLDTPYASGSPKTEMMAFDLLLKHDLRFEKNFQSSVSRLDLWSENLWWSIWLEFLCKTGNSTSLLLRQRRYIFCAHGHMARGGHGIPRVLLGPAMPDPSTPCRWPLLKRSYSRFRGGCQHGGRPAVVFYPFGHPAPYASVCALSW
jgi:hypothetical protein